MKIFTSLFFSFFLSLTFLSAQRIPAPKPVIVKLTSTECNICGLGAWDNFKAIIEQYEEEAVIMAVHPLKVSALFSNTALEFTDNLPNFFGTPTLYINEEVHFQFWIQGIKDFMATYQQRRPTAYPFIDYQIDNNKLIVNVKAQFLKATNRPHYLSVYVIEDQVNAPQSSRGPEDRHSKVLRTHMGENTMGTLLSEDYINKDDEFQTTYTLEIDPDWNPEKLEIAAIIWEKRGDTYDVVNSNTALEPTFATSVNALEAANVKMNILPTIISNQARVQLDLPEAQNGLELSVVNSLGQEVKNIFSGNLPIGNRVFDIERTDFGSGGIHFLVLKKGTDSIVRKLVLK